MVPKSSAFFTRPMPKTSCQKRFTVTRAVSGFSGETIHCARPSRFFGAFAGMRVKHGRCRRANFVFRLVVLAAKENVRHRLGIFFLLLHERDGTASTDERLLGFQRA